MKRKKSLANQVEDHANKTPEKSADYEGDSVKMISTGSTLLDLAISGGRIHGGGIPAGILVEIFGPSGTGKTVLLCEIAGAVQRQGGSIMFHDPEARLNKQFAEIFDFNVDNATHDFPSTVSELFAPIREWKPEPEGIVHGIFSDSLAALTTKWEEEGKDQYGMRRAKEFSEQCRLVCRHLANQELLMVCSNQVRQNLDAGPYGQKYKSPGGEAIGFYSSLRLRCIGSKKITKKRTIKGQEHSRVEGVETEIEVYKSSVWKPYRKAVVPIIFDYGIDDIRANLQYLRTYKGSITIDNKTLSNSVKTAIKEVETENLESELKDEVIKAWQEIEDQFTIERKPKERK